MAFIVNALEGNVLEAFKELHHLARVLRLIMLHLSTELFSPIASLVSRCPHKCSGWPAGGATFIAAH